ncbi:MAG TPA: CHAT domain-containing protein [Pyrinomonadaceae bacterium]|nr:CHAT domain-containing protein [Pyrinomonadaceae bacterium]
MESVTYLDFDLEIERGQDGYRVEVINSPSGQASCEFKLPFSSTEVENLLLKLGHTRGRKMRRVESPEVVAVKQFGERLFNTIFSGDVQSCLRSSIEEAERQGIGLRLRLHLTEVPELAVLPWEYLYNSRLNRFISISNRTPLVRYMDLPERIRPLTVAAPLRVLAMISSPAQSEYEELDVEREWKILKEALGELEQQGMVQLERLDDASLIGLQRQLRRKQYHVLHFIGHGGFDHQSQCGVLVMEGEGGRDRLVSGQELGALLHDEETMRLAVLNACEGARGSETDSYAGVAQSLLQQGVPAVVAMQFEITDQAAISLAREFYGAIADNYPVDAALAEARKTIFAEGNSLEWGTPVLYLRAPDGKIFDVKQISEEERKRIQSDALYSDALSAIGRQDWSTAEHKLQTVVQLEPDKTEATAKLKEVQAHLATTVAPTPPAADEERQKEQPREEPSGAKVRAAVEAPDEKAEDRGAAQSGQAEEQKKPESKNNAAVGLLQKTEPRLLGLPRKWLIISAAAVILIVGVIIGAFAITRYSRTKAARQHFQQGEQAYMDKNYEEAVNHYGQATAVKPDYFEAYIKRGRAYFELRDYDSAIAQYQMVLGQQSEAAVNQYADAYLQQGLAYHQKGQYDDAIGCYWRAIERRKDNPDAQYNLGLSYSKKGDTALAAKQVEILKQMDKPVLVRLLQAKIKMHEAERQYALGLNLLKQGDRAGAKKQLDILRQMGKYGSEQANRLQGEMNRQGQESQPSPQPEAESKPASPPVD